MNRTAFDLLALLGLCGGTYSALSQLAADRLLPAAVLALVTVLFVFVCHDLKKELSHDD
jgi:hypothetical protein